MPNGHPSRITVMPSECFPSGQNENHYLIRTDRSSSCFRTTAAAVASSAVTEADHSVSSKAVVPVVAPTTTSKTPVATSKTLTTTTPVATSTGGGGTCSDSSRRGLSWTNNYLTTQDQFLPGACWCYNWGFDYCSKAEGIDNVPMLWGIDEARLTGWAEAIKGKHYANALAFNECVSPFSFSFFPPRLCTGD